MNDPRVEWFRGEQIRDTGVRVWLYGGQWRVCVYLTGRLAGEECLRPAMGG